MTLSLICLLVAGILLGSLIIPETWGNELDYIARVILYILLFLVGISLGLQRKKLKKLIDLGRQAILLPFGTMLGSLLGGMLGSIMTGHHLTDGLAIASGMGYYSLTGAMLQKLRGVEIGMVAFLANFLREVMTYLVVPFCVKLHPSTAIAFGGVTTMDVTLPIIKRYTTSEYAVLAFFHGVILTFFVPILINLFVLI